MCHTRKQPTEVHGTCKWIGGNKVATAALSCGWSALLEIQPEGKESGCYWVSQIDGGWSLARQEPTGEQGPRYDIEQGGASCDCPDATYRPRPGGCKHVKALRAALAAIGLEL